MRIDDLKSNAKENVPLFNNMRFGPQHDGFPASYFAFVWSYSPGELPLGQLSNIDRTADILCMAS